MFFYWYTRASNSRPEKSLPRAWTEMVQPRIYWWCCKIPGEQASAMSFNLFWPSWAWNQHSAGCEHTEVLHVLLPNGKTVEAKWNKQNEMAKVLTSHWNVFECIHKNASRIKAPKVPKSLTQKSASNAKAEAADAKDRRNGRWCLCRQNPLNAKRNILQHRAQHPILHHLTLHTIVLSCAETFTMGKVCTAY